MWVRAIHFPFKKKIGTCLGAVGNKFVGANFAFIVEKSNIFKVVPKATTSRLVEKVTD